MTAHEIEMQLLREGLAPYPHDTFDFSQGSEAQRVGADGEYSLADYMEGDSSPEAQAIIDQLMALMTPEEIEAAIVDHGGEPDAPEPEPSLFDWLKR